MTLWPTLPDARERFVAEVFAVMREVLGSNVDGDLAIRYLLVRVLGAREAINIADHDRLNLERTQFAVTANGSVVAAGFDRDECGK